MNKQKFHKGDLAIKKEGGEKVRVIILYSYGDEYGFSEHTRETYAVYCEDSGFLSWIDPPALTLIKRDQHEILKQWEEKRENDNRIKSDLDWIFSNGPEVLENRYGASIQALASCFGLDNLWGKNGEGIRYYENSLKTLSYSAEFLRARDKQGWLDRCVDLKRVIKDWRRS